MALLFFLSLSFSTIKFILSSYCFLRSNSEFRICFASTLYLYFPIHFQAYQPSPPNPSSYLKANCSHSISIWFLEAICRTLFQVCCIFVGEHRVVSYCLFWTPMLPSRLPIIFLLLKSALSFILCKLALHRAHFAVSLSRTEMLAQIAVTHSLKGS